MIDLTKNKTSVGINVTTSLNNFNSNSKDSSNIISNDDKFSALIALSDKNLQKLKGKFKEEDVNLKTPFEEVPFDNFKSFVYSILSAGDLNNINQGANFDNIQTDKDLKFFANDMVKNIDHLENIKQKLSDNVSSTIGAIDNISLEDLKTLEQNIKGNKLNLSPKVVSAIDVLDHIAASENSKSKSLNSTIGELNLKAIENSQKIIIENKKDSISDIVKYKDAYIKIEKASKSQNQDIASKSEFTNDGLKLNDFLITQNVKFSDVNSDKSQLNQSGNIENKFNIENINSKNILSDGIKQNVDLLNQNPKSIDTKLNVDNKSNDTKFIFNDTKEELSAQHFKNQKESNFESNGENSKNGSKSEFAKSETKIEENILKSQAGAINQNIFTKEIFKAEMKEIAPRTFSNVNPNEINAPIVKTINDMHGDGSTVAKLILNPANLGTIRVEISVRENVANIKINADSADIAKTIEAQLPALKEKLAENGIKSDNFDLNYNNKQGESSDSLAYNQQQNSKKEEGEVRKRYLEFMKRLGDLEQSFSEKFGYEPEPAKTKV